MHALLVQCSLNRYVRWERAKEIERQNKGVCLQTVVIHNILLRAFILSFERVLISFRFCIYIYISVYFYKTGVNAYYYVFVLREDMR